MWKGRCEVHEEFTPEEIIEFRENEPGVKVIAHPRMFARCPRSI